MPPATTLTILTGASRGMGRAMAEQLLQPGQVLLGISRQSDPALDTLAAQRGARLTQWKRDLSEAGPVTVALGKWLAQFQPDALAQVRLINNAGVIGPLGAVEQATPEALVRALRVGLEATVLLTAAFLQHTAHWTGQRRVLNISSGLGRRAMAGSAAYCAAKAGMDHYSRALALEQAERPNGARIVALAPGVIDTDMQSELRGAPGEGFPDQARFLALKANAQLDSPRAAASKVLAYLAREDFGQQPVADVRD
jgi:NAD(P)-dependent dehydrogenase (short-subunit alcohol dehydrogenase family)